MKERSFPHSNHLMLYNEQLALPSVSVTGATIAFFYSCSVTSKKMTGKEPGERECKEDK